MHEATTDRLEVCLIFILEVEERIVGFVVVCCCACLLFVVCHTRTEVLHLLDTQGHWTLCVDPNISYGSETVDPELVNGQMYPFAVLKFFNRYVLM